MEKIVKGSTYLNLDVSTRERSTPEDKNSLVHRPTPLERPVFVAGAIAQAKRIADRAASS